LSDQPKPDSRRPKREEKPARKSERKDGVSPLDKRIPEGKDNLRRRSAWFRERTKSTD